MNRQLYTLFYDSVPHWYLLFSTMCSVFLFLPQISLFLRRNCSILKSKVLLHCKHLISSPSIIQYKWIHTLPGFPPSPPPQVEVNKYTCRQNDRMGARYRRNLHDAVSRAQQCCQQNQTHSPCISSYNQCHSGVLWGTVLFKHHHSWSGTVISDLLLEQHQYFLQGKSIPWVSIYFVEECN